MRIPRLVVFLTALMISVVAAHCQAASSYPTRPVRLLIPFAPGGSSDYVVRIIQPRLAEYLGQQAIIENRAGASGNIGVEIAANATPDGHTLLVGNIGAMAINPSVFTQFHVRPLRDFIGITLLSDVPGVLVVHPSIPVSTLREFVSYVKERPGKLSYGSAGAGSPLHLTMEYFLRKSGLDILHVPYKGGAGAAAIAIVGGEVQTSLLSLPSLSTFIKGGRLKLIAVMAQHRHPLHPDIPTFAESGFTDMTVSAWQGVFVPKATPRWIVDHLFGVFSKVMREPQVDKLLATSGAQVVLSKSPEDFLAFWKGETERWQGVVNGLGLAQQ